MIFKCKGVIAEKGTFEGVSKKTGNPYKMYNVFVQDNGILTKLTANQMIYEKAEKGKEYEFLAKVKDFGNIEINDIQLCK